MNRKVCVTELYLGNEQITFYDKKASNEQGFWIDNGDACGFLPTYYFVTETKIKNGKVTTSCDDT